MFIILSETDRKSSIFGFKFVEKQFQPFFKKSKIHNCERKKFGINLERVHYDKLDSSIKTLNFKLKTLEVVNTSLNYFRSVFPYMV